MPLKPTISLRQRLFRIILVTSGLAWLCVAVAVVWYEAAARPRALTQLQGKADILGKVLLAPLEFDSPDNAQDYLKACDAFPEISVAALYNAKGITFATYVRKDSKIVIPNVPGPEGAQVTAHEISLCQTLTKNGKVIGQLLLIEHLPPLYARLSQYLLMAVPVLLALVLMSVMLQFSLRQGILKPLSALVSTTGKVVQTNDYSIRTTLPREDEIGQLARAFDEMLEVIGRRDASLRAATTQIQNVFAATTEVAIISTDIRGLVIVFNSGAERMLGYTANEVVGKETPLLWHLPSEIEAWATLLGRQAGQPIQGFDVFATLARQTNHNAEEWTWGRKDGTALQVHLEVTAVKDAQGEIAGYLGVASDITERKRAADELRHLQSLLSNIINSMPSTLVAVDAQGKVTQWNLGAEKATGLRAVHSVGQPLDQVLPVLAGQMDRVRAAIQQRQVQIHPKLVSKSNDEIVYHDLVVYPLVANGITGAVIRLDDVTEKVRLEEMLMQSEKMLSVGGLAAGMAHEINNPLAGMIQNAQVMKDRLTTDMPRNVKAAQEAGVTMEVIRKYMEQREIVAMLSAIIEGGSRAAQIVQNMLSFSRKSESALIARNLAELMDRTIELAGNDYDLKKKYDFRQITIVREYEPDLPWVPCDASKLQQVLLNLLTNGAQAMAGMKDHHPQFVMRLRREDSWAIIEVEDNGPGMTETVRKRIFEPFFTTKEVGVGTGLGLSVSFFIITQIHGGTIEVESEPDRGARFIIRLPLKRSIL